MSKAPLTIGADPELFLVDVAGNFISAVGKVGGSKHRPRSIGQGCAVQEDNVAVEYNIAPAKTVDEFLRYNSYALNTIAKEMADKGLFLSITASKVFNEDQLLTPAAKVFGCDPDFNAWTRKENPRPEANNPSLRSAGGHIHIGSPLDKLQLIRWCDIILGLPSVFEDADTQRRELYGKAGAFRAKPYGVEYRTLSNYWLSSEEMMRRIWGRVEEVVMHVEERHILADNEGEEIQRAINTSDRELAKQLIAKYA